LAAVVVYYANFPSPDTFVNPGAFCGSKTSFSDKPTSAAARQAASWGRTSQPDGSGSIARLSGANIQQVTVGSIANTSGPHGAGLHSSDAPTGAEGDAKLFAQQTFGGSVSIGQNAD
jgi:hypothetical protein